MFFFEDWTWENDSFHMFSSFNNSKVVFGLMIGSLAIVSTHPSGKRSIQTLHFSILYFLNNDSKNKKKEINKEYLKNYKLKLQNSLIFLSNKNTSSWLWTTFLISTSSQTPNIFTGILNFLIDFDVELLMIPIFFYKTWCFYYSWLNIFTFSHLFIQYKNIQSSIIKESRFIIKNTKRKQVRN